MVAGYGLVRRAIINFNCEQPRPGKARGQQLRVTSTAGA
jgi:hypothetical protein